MSYPVMGLGTEPSDMKYRFNWNAPIVASTNRSGVIYHGGNVVFKSVDNGVTWDVISDDLTRNDKEKQGPGGIPITNESAGGENYNTISYMAASNHETGVLYVGTDDGRLHITRNDGETWQEISPPGIGESLINSIEISQHDPGTAWAVVTKYKFNDNRPYLFETKDYGKTWTSHNKGFDPAYFVRVVREDPYIKGLLYAGTENGLFVSRNKSEGWLPMQLNLPVCPINDLYIQDNDLIVATSGRAFWILDDLTVLQESATGYDENSAIVFRPKPTVKFGINGGRSAPSNAGQNPLPGVIIDYHLPEDSLEIEMVIRDDAGKTVRSYSSVKDSNAPEKTVLKTHKGVNRFNWNLRTENLPKVEGVRLLTSLNGHSVPPGLYTVTLKVDGDSSKANIVVVPYPHIEAEKSDYNDQYAFLNDVRDVFSDIHNQVNYSNEVVSQLKLQSKFLKKDSTYKELTVLSDSIIGDIEDWKSELIQPKQKTFQDIINFPNQLNAELANLAQRVDGLDPVVTQGARERYSDLSNSWKDLKNALTSIYDGPLQSYQKKYLEMKVPIIHKRME